MYEQGVGLPEELEELPPGPGLAALLTGVDRSTISERDRIRLARARYRLIAHQHAELLSDLYALSQDEPPGDGRVAGRQSSAYPCSEAEVAFALRWSAGAAGARLEQARQLHEDIPEVHTALSAGDIDLTRAAVIAEIVGWLPDPATARAVVARIIDRASGWTAGQLRARLRRLVLAADPTAAARRTRAAVTGRRVELYDNPDGTGDLAGRGLPPQDAAAAWERLTAIARAAKHAGDPRTLTQLRADALLDLLIGEGVALGHPIGAHTADPGSPAVPTPPPPGAPTPNPAPSPAPSPAPAPRRGVVELQVPLSTLLELSDEPGELAGYGPVVADIARQVAAGAAARADTQWRFSVFDDLGALRHHGTTRRPSPATAAFVRARDRTCTAPGCRRPARQCDLDHTTAWADGGQTHPDNLSALCRRHHRFKHTAGAHLTSFGSGHLGWTTPRGLQYRTAPDPPWLTGLGEPP